jgi:ABC-type sugar transport system ATPase subunit
MEGWAAMNEQTMRISAVGVHKSYGAVRALRNGQLRIRPGETHALVGENGAGKSTIIKILSGAIQRDGGLSKSMVNTIHPAIPTKR